MARDRACAAGSLLVVAASEGNEADLLPAQFDFEFVAGLEIELGGVGLDDQQIGIELKPGGEAEFAAGPSAAGNFSDNEASASSSSS